MTPITPAQLARLTPNAIPDYLKAFADGAPILAQAEINTGLRVAHFMAQVLHECGGLTIRQENLNYSAERMVVVWPSRFPTVEAAGPFAHNPQALANNVYNGRMGNKTGSDDGWNFRGRGLLQLTGRDAYESIGRTLTRPLADQPDLAFGVVDCLAIATAEWGAKSCNALADNDDLKGVTRAINGGLIGLAERRDWLLRTKAVWLPSTPSARTPLAARARKKQPAAANV